MKTARVLGIDLEALECLSANVAGVLDPGFRSQAQGVLPKCAGQTEVPLRIELVRSLIANGQLTEALTEVDLVLAVRPNDPNAQQLRAQIRAALGN